MAKRQPSKPPPDYRRDNLHMTNKAQEFELLTGQTLHMNKNEMLRETLHTAYVVDSTTGQQTYAIDTDPDRAIDKLLVKLLGE